MDEQNAETQDLKEDSSDVIVDEYKDMPIELMPSSRKKFLQMLALLNYTLENPNKDQLDFTCLLDLPPITETGQYLLFDEHALSSRVKSR